MDDLVVAYSKNLSKGGLFLRTDKSLPAGSIVRLHIELPDGGGELVLECRVVYVRDPTDWDSLGQAAGMGIQFVDPDDEARGRIERFIAECSVPSSNAVATPRPSRQVNVLVVDDDEAYCKVASDPFRARGDIVRIAHDGIQAFAECLKEKPDVILCDVQMPKMDGWQLLRLVRSRPALASVAFVLLSQLDSEEARLRGYRLGVDDYIAKPYRPEEVVARADRAFARAEQVGASATTATLRGDLEQVGLAGLLSFLEFEKKTGTLRVLASEPSSLGSTARHSMADLSAPAAVHREARVRVRDGAPVRVEIEGSSGSGSRRRLFELLDWTAGQFEFVQEDVSEPDEIGVPVASLLLEHAQEQDEGRRP
jgi:uncharacterized protein (TIGR02266 family)